MKDVVQIIRGNTDVLGDLRKADRFGVMAADKVSGEIHDILFTGVVMLA